MNWKQLLFHFVRLVIAASLLILHLGCCPAREMGVVTSLNDTVGCCGAVKGHLVTSPRASNLTIVLTWSDPTADLNMRVTVVNCIKPGGCPARTSQNPLGQAREEILVDGSPGIQWNVEIIGDTQRAQAYNLLVTFDTGTCT